MPANPDWGYGSLAEAFALSFDGYAWGEAQTAPVDPRQLAVDVEQGAAIRTWTADALRAALFGLQRRYRDGVSTPDRAHIERLLTALRDRLAG
ncbi:hypothetical protein SAMN04488509_1141 [Aquimonas voraii]|uniref:Uncharacterized protein n=1 Tax=Aquimonas voraii TaxID=265719 RepID=A0A1G6ZHK9_9GAMM|nr:hypothetical protein SAMN04488509_1141 [Aquimonas voraii]